MKLHILLNRLDRFSSVGDVGEDIDKFILDAKEKNVDKGLFMIDLIAFLGDNCRDWRDADVAYHNYVDCENSNLTIDRYRDNLKDAAKLIKFLMEDNPLFIYSWFSALGDLTTYGTEKYMKDNDYASLLRAGSVSTYECEDDEDEKIAMMSNRSAFFNAAFLLNADSKWVESVLDKKMAPHQDTLIFLLGEDFFKKRSKTRKKYLEHEIGI